MKKAIILLSAIMMTLNLNAQEEKNTNEDIEYIAKYLSVLYPQS